MGDNPKILPKPLNAPNAGAGAKSLFSNPKSKLSLRVGVACFACKTKRSKVNILIISQWQGSLPTQFLSSCSIGATQGPSLTFFLQCDGARPRCNACIEKHSDCLYPTRAGQSHSQAKKQLIRELQNDKSAMFEILWYLQTTSPEKASDFLNQLRSVHHGDIGAMSEYVSKDAMFIQSDRHASFSSETDFGGSPCGAASVDAGEDFQSTRVPNESASFLQAPNGQDTSIESVRAALDMFHHCIGGLFYVFDKSEVDTTFNSIATTDLTLADLVNSSESMAIRTHAAEVAAMAAMGIFHLQLQMPETAPSIELADFYYAVGKQGLDSAIKYNPLRAMKLCALIAFYNIAVHATVALAYIELGLSLARNHGAHLEQVTSNMTPETMGHRRTRQTLVHLHCWLSASLGLRSDSLDSSLQMIVDEHDELPVYVVQQQVVKITIIKAAFIQITADEFTQESTVAEFRAKLSNFCSDMPKWMSVSQLLNDPSHDVPPAVVFYVHLFYMSAMMLLARRLIITHVPLNSIGKVELPRESSLAIEEGFLAARMSARIMGLMLTEGSVVPMCWLCIFTAYTACIMIIYHGIQKTLRGINPDQSEDFELITKCQTILSYCAERDKLAQAFHATITRNLEILHDHCMQNENFANNQDNEAPLIDVLFTFHPGPTPLHSAARELLALLHAPFHGLPRRPPESTLRNSMEAVLGAHVEWNWEMERGYCNVDTSAEGDMGGGGEDEEVANSFSRLQHEDSGGWTTWTSPGHFRM